MAFPEEAKSYYENVQKAEEDRENYLQAREDKLIKYVYGLKKQEAQQLLLEVLESGPEWQWDRFIREHIEYKATRKKPLRITPQRLFQKRF